MKAYTLSFLILTAICFSAPRTALADLLSNPGADVTVTVSPSSPGPLENVTVTLSSFSVDLNRAKISWSLDGKQEPSGTGVKTFSFRAGTVGKKSTVDIAIGTADGQTISKQVVVEPNDLDLLWESPDSYVPPFYEGKALPASEATIKVVAIPTASISPGTLVYQWKRNFTVSQKNSGYGKNAFVFQNDYLNDKEDVSVQAADGTGGTYSAQASLEIVPYSPKILFYEVKPAEGEDFNNALSNGWKMTGTEATIAAEPYFFSPKTALDKNFNYSWSINDNSIATPEVKNVLTVRPDSGAVGTGKISLSLENAATLFQAAKNSLLINF